MLITVDTSGLPPGVVAAIVRHSLEGLAVACAPFFRSGILPPLAQSGIRYVRDESHQSGTERFMLPPSVYARKRGDCDQLVLYRLSELYDRGEKRAGVRCAWMGGNLHVQIRRASGKIEDPSIELGAPSNWPHHLLWEKQK